VRKLKLREGTNTAVLFGHHDRHLKLIEEDLGVRLSARGEELTLDGNPEATRYAERVLTELAGLANDGMLIQPDDVTHALTALRQSPETPLKELLSNATAIVTKKRFVAPKTPTQKTYIEAIETHDIVIGIGPAGTGKTYLAMAMAVSALMKTRGQPHHSGQACRRSWRETRISARRHDRQSQSVSPPPL
jgi:phosphate starvation-inducible PhoH-like protein